MTMSAPSERHSSALPALAVVATSPACKQFLASWSAARSLDTSDSQPATGAIAAAAAATARPRTKSANTASARRDENALACLHVGGADERLVRREADLSSSRTIESNVRVSTSEYECVQCSIRA